MPDLKMTIIDQDKILTDSLLQLSRLGAFEAFEIVNSFNDPQDFFKNHKERRALILFELNMKGITWKEFLEKAKKEYPENKFIVLSKYEGSDYVKQAFVDGVDGYISKKENLAGLKNAITKVMEGENYLSSHLSISPKLYPIKPAAEKDEDDLPDSFEIRQKLSSREIEILNGIVNANSTKEIADQLYISEQTVAVHKKNIMKKLRVNNTIGLIKTAFENGLVEN